MVFRDLTGPARSENHQLHTSMLHTACAGFRGLGVRVYGFKDFGPELNYRISPTWRPTMLRRFRV